MSDESEISKHPSEYFIKYLMTIDSADAQKDEWIQYGVQAFGFPTPTIVYLEDLRETVYQDVPVDYDPKDRYNRASVKYLRGLGVWSMHNPDEAVNNAMQLLGNSKARKIIEQLLLGRIDPGEVAKKANSRLQSFFTVETIQAYAHYFWNTSLLKTNEWLHFFENYDRGDTSKSISVLHGGPSSALHHAGFQQNLESKEMLREMMEGIYFDFKDWKAQPMSVNKTRALTNLAKSATQIDVRLSEADSALRDSLKAFEAFRMEHAQKGVQSIDDLAPQGNFTESGIDIKELPPKSEEG